MRVWRWLHRERQPNTVAPLDGRREVDRLSPKDEIDQLRKDLDTLQKDITDLNTQARWWLTIWGGLLVFTFGDGGVRLTAFFERLNAASDQIASNLTVIVGLAFLASGVLLLRAAWPRTAGRTIGPGQIPATWHLANLRRRIKVMYENVAVQRGAIAIGLPLLVCSLLAWALAEARLENPNPGSRDTSTSTLLETIALLGVFTMMVVKWPHSDDPFRRLRYMARRARGRFTNKVRGRLHRRHDT